jgi:hypothetical protein
VTEQFRDDVVHLIDLRDRGAQDALSEVVGVLDDPPPGLGGLIVVDDVDLLDQHEGVYAHITASNQVNGRLLVVAVGPLPSERVLPVPSSLQAGRESRVLWVGDERGVRWSPTSTTVVRLTEPDPKRSLAQLLTVLRTPEVHEAVCGLSGVAVASPGLTVLGSAWSEAVAVQALLRALARLCADRPVAGGTPDVEAALRSLQILPNDRPGGSALVDGRLRDAVERCDLAVQDARTQCRTLDGLRTLVWGTHSVKAVTRHRSEAAEQLRLLRAHSLALRDGGLATGAFDPALVQEQCEHFGVRPSAGPAPDAYDLARRAGQLVASWVEQGRPLAEIRQRLTQIEAALHPEEAAAHHRAVDRACPEALPQRLATARPFPRLPRRLLAAGTVLGAAAAFSPWMPPVVIAVVALVWGGALACWPESRPLAPLRRATAGLLTGAVGVIGLLVIRRTLPWWWSINVELWILLAVLALAAVAVLLAQAWRGAVGSWSACLDLDEAAASILQMVDTVESMVRTEWTALEARTVGIDTVIRARAVVEGARTALSGLVGSLPAADLTESRADTEYWEVVVDGHTRSLLLGALENEWSRMPSHSARELEHDCQVQVDRGFRIWLTELRRGSLQAPSNHARRATIDRLGADAMDSLRRVVGGDVMLPMRQYLAPTDVTVLDKGGESIVPIRFAPQVLPAQARSALPSGTKLSAGALLAGLLRLVPLRAAATRLQGWNVGEGPRT